MRKRLYLFSGLLIFIAVLSLPLGAEAQNYSSSIRKKINSLDNDKVENVPMPILFGLTPDNMTRNFGDPRGSGRSHEGLDIMAPRRALIVSPTEAVVIRTGEGDSAGKYVYTANPGGEVFAYLHLDEIADIDEGDKLAKGDFIGYVGNTGNASGGATHLHFEIHDDDGDPTDPYPRIESIFPIADKIEYLEEILEDVKDEDGRDDEEELAKALVILYRKDFLLAKSFNIALPGSIEAALLSVPVPPASSGSGTRSPGDLSLGSKGAAVKTLQEFLLQKNIGSANLIVPDGSFGPITRQALIDYQIEAGIAPASGYYGPKTRSYIAAHP